MRETRMCLLVRNIKTEYGPGCFTETGGNS